jgi:hypothetical protein
VRRQVNIQPQRGTSLPASVAASNVGSARSLDTQGMQLQFVVDAADS